MVKKHKLDVDQWLEAVSDAAFVRYGLLWKDYDAYLLLHGYVNGDSAEHFARHNVPSDKIRK
jgi:hypothetical protein